MGGQALVLVGDKGIPMRAFSKLADVVLRFAIRQVGTYAIHDVLDGAEDRADLNMRLSVAWNLRDILHENQHIWRPTERKWRWGAVWGHYYRLYEKLPGEVAPLEPVEMQLCEVPMWTEKEAEENE